MSPNTPILILRFPDGDVEHRTTRGELPIGALVRTRGARWRVESYADGAAILVSAEPVVEGAPSGPLVIPDMLGDKPLIVEVLLEV
jgi:hypothetical protein